MYFHHCFLPLLLSPFVLSQALFPTYTAINAGRDETGLLQLLPTTPIRREMVDVWVEVEVEELGLSLVNPG